MNIFDSEQTQLPRFRRVKFPVKRLSKHQTHIQGAQIISEQHNIEIIEAEATEITVYQPTVLDDFSAELFSEYLVPNSFDNSKDFSAYGIEHIAGELGYSITKQEIISETDTHAIIKAKLNAYGQDDRPLPQPVNPK